MARRQELIGIAFAGMLKQRKYFVNAAGEAHRNPTFSIGMVQVLTTELGLRARGGGGD